MFAYIVPEAAAHFAWRQRPFAVCCKREHSAWQKSLVRGGGPHFQWRSTVLRRAKSLRVDCRSARSVGSGRPSASEDTHMYDQLSRTPKRPASRLGAAALFMAVAWLMPMAAFAQTTIKFMAWNFQVETVQDFVKQFEAENPSIKVDLEIIPSAQYAAKI